jgi:hypothetical protein
MSGRGRGGRGRGGGRGGRGRGRGRGHTGGSATSSKSKGLCKALEHHVYDYGQKSAADTLKTTTEKLVDHIGTTMGHEISTEIRTRTRVVLDKPDYDQAIKDRHEARKIRLNAQYLTLRQARENSLRTLQAVDEASRNYVEIATIEIAMQEAEARQAEEPPVEMTNLEKTEYDNKWRTYREREANLEKQRGQAYSMIRGQCTEVLLDKMKQDPDWNQVQQNSNDPLGLLALIEKTVLAQSADQYPFAMVYDQEAALYGFSQQQLPNVTYYDRFNNRVAVGKAIGISKKHKCLSVFVAEEKGLDYDSMSEADKIETDDDAEERYLAYVMLRQSGKQHSKLKTDLHNLFTTGENKFPTTRPGTLHLLDKHTKQAIVPEPTSEGTSFHQRGKAGGKAKSEGDDLPFDPKFWKSKKCNDCGRFGHPARHCPDKDKEKKKSSKEDDDSKSRSSKSSSRSVSSSIEKLKKKQKEMKKQFATIEAAIEEINEESDISDSDSDDSTGNQHFQVQKGFQMFQNSVEQRRGRSKSPGVMPKRSVTFYGIVLQQFEKRNQKVLFKKNHSKRGDFDLTRVILLDNQSTMDLFCNPGMVADIYLSKGKMHLQSNGGTLVIHHKARIHGYHTEVWFSTDAITNIISYKNLAKQYRITSDSKDGTFIVHREEFGKHNMVFRMHESGLHYYDPCGQDFVFTNTVSDNMRAFSKRQIEGAKRARDLYESLGYPSPADFKWAIRSNLIRDCPVTLEDIDNAHSIWGKSIAALKGKTTRRKPIPVADDVIPIPRDLMKQHKRVYLTTDLFFVNKIPFFITYSRNICLTSVNHLANRKVKTIFTAFVEIYSYYIKRGFQIKFLHLDGEFAPLQALVNEHMPAGPRVNLASAKEHVPEIERRIRVVKERTRAIRHGLPFNRIPPLLLVWIVFAAVRMLNSFPVKGGISDTLSPRAIMSGDTLHYKRHLSIKVGDYCQVHEQDEPRNSNVARTQGAICLGPTGNKQGGFFFMSLTTGQKINRYSFDLIPTPDTVIHRVNELGRGQPEELVFFDRKGRPIGDVEITGVDEHSSEEANEAPQIEAAPIVNTDLNQHLNDTTINPNDEAPDEQAPEVEQPPVMPTEIDETAVEAPTPTVAPVPAAAAAPTTTTNAGDQEIPGVRRSGRSRTQVKRYSPSMTGKRYEYALSQIQLKEAALYPDTHMFFHRGAMQAEPDVVGAIMTQLSLKAGLKRWGDKGRAAVHSEMKQLHMRETFRPLHYEDLTEAERRSVLESHLFLKEKRDGKIKGRTVAGGNKQRDFISKEDASSPTVATESVLLTCIIDAEEGRDVATVDIPNAFIQTRIEDEKDMAIIRIRGVLVDMLLEIAPDVYGPYVRKTGRNGEKVLTVQCLNAIYGTMTASLLYYRKFCNSLISRGYELNPYDPCVANKIIDGHQMTICFHVDDCKLSHKDPKVVDKTIKWLRREYESIFEDGSGAMTVHRGKVHTYLGMTLDYSMRGLCKVTMFDYLDEILTTFSKIEPKEDGTKSTAAPSNLFTIDEDCEKLAPERAKQFHNLVAKTLYATKRARPDTCTSVAFLTTRVQEPDKDDWKKLTHLMKYIRGTRDLPLILGANGSGILKWWIDASFAVHPNMRGHTGGGLSMGRGFPITSSTKQKLNARSSTEAEIIGVDDLMPSICWTRCFMEAQGYGIEDSIVYQDNKSAILLERNGKSSGSKRTKHINVRYFFVTDRINKKELSVEWCPTADMTGDYMTKPLQGSQFRRFRDEIMGVYPMKSPSKDKKGK